jgi:general secretion pathway protein G
MKDVTIVIFLAALLLNTTSHATTWPPNTALNDIRWISGALETCNLEQGRYPTQVEGLRALLNRPKENWTGYIKTLPKDPWGNDYVYCYPGKHNTNSFDLYSLGANGRSKTVGNDRDDINNWDPTQKWNKYYRRPWRNLSDWESLIICGIGIAVVSGLIFVWRSVGSVREFN